MYSVAIVDDEAAIRNGLATRIDWTALGYTIAGTFEDGEDVLAFLNGQPVDVVLTDIRMAVVSGLDVARELSTRHPNTEVVLLSGYREFEYAREAMRFGVRHYLLKPTVPSEIREVFETLRRELASRAEEPGSQVSRVSSDESTLLDNEQPALAAIRSAKRFVSEHLSEELSLDRMAREFYFSPAYFSRLFHRVAGCGFTEYVNCARMDRAAELLAERPASRVQNVARRVGLRDRRYFSRLFKQRFGVTPSRYRAALRQADGGNSEH